MPTSSSRPSIRIRTAQTDDDIRRCWPLLSGLRPHLRAARFIPQVRRQQAQGYSLVVLESRGRVCAVAGYRVLENLAWGRFLYVDDLVTAPAQRSRGHGSCLIHWLAVEARRQQCAELHLDSGVHRFDAHRFYLQHRMHLTCHHFALPLK
jgi:GNAT superfamily N-acetyltransferase